MTVSTWCLRRLVAIRRRWCKTSNLGRRRLHQLGKDGTAQGPSHDGRPSDYTTVKKSRWGPPMTASNVLSTTTMASNDLSTTNTALDVSSVTAVSSEPVLAGTDLAGTDLAGSVADLAGPDSGQVQVPIWQVPIWQVPILGLLLALAIMRIGSLMDAISILTVFLSRTGSEPNCRWPTSSRRPSIRPPSSSSARCCLISRMMVSPRNSVRWSILSVRERKTYRLLLRDNTTPPTSTLY